MTSKVLPEPCIFNGALTMLSMIGEVHDVVWEQWYSSVTEIFSL
jgi:hypothetical protein